MARWQPQQPDGSRWEAPVAPPLVALQIPVSMAVTLALYRRRVGLDSTWALGRALDLRSALSLQVAWDVNLEGGPQPPALALDVDSAEQRYLLAGRSDCSITIYDTAPILTGPRPPYSTRACLTLRAQRACVCINLCVC